MITEHNKQLQHSILISRKLVAQNKCILIVVLFSDTHTHKVNDNNTLERRGGQLVIFRTHPPRFAIWLSSLGRPAAFCYNLLARWLQQTEQQLNLTIEYKSPLLALFNNVSFIESQLHSLVWGCVFVFGPFGVHTSWHVCIIKGICLCGCKRAYNTESIELENMPQQTQRTPPHIYSHTHTHYASAHTHSLNKIYIYIYCTNTHTHTCGKNIPDFAEKAKNSKQNEKYRSIEFKGRELRRLLLLLLLWPPWLFGWLRRVLLLLRVRTRSSTILVIDPRLTLFSYIYTYIQHTHGARGALLEQLDAHALTDDDGFNSWRRGGGVWGWHGGGQGGDECTIYICSVSDQKHVVSGVARAARDSYKKTTHKTHRPNRWLPATN